MNKFRQLITAEIASRLRPVLVSEAAVAYREKVLKMFLSRGADRALIQQLLRALPRGDWRNRNDVEYMPPHDAASVAQVIANGLCFCLAGSNFIVFSRSRWTKADLSVDQIGLCESVSGLISAVYPKFVAAHGKVAKAQGVAPGLLPFVPDDGQAEQN